MTREERLRKKREEHRRNRDRYRESESRYREANREKLRAYFRKLYHEKRRHDPQYMARSAAYQKRRRRDNYQRVREIERKSYERHKQTRLDRQKRLARSPQTLARAYVNRAVRDKKLVRARTFSCIKCLGPAREYHHHKGYARANWLAVVPVCSTCHKAMH